ncbi:hypothetical protein [Kitasatospora sp. NPDC088134]|uniref:hypothetical protein n=1 Tax=Kitasatospora sp. NPDC088134 TaxID=3364071 RepID=UPI00382B1CF3
MERAALILVLIVYMVTGVRYYRTPLDESDPGKLVYARITERRTVEIWRRGLSIDVRVIDQH